MEIGKQHKSGLFLSPEGQLLTTHESACVCVCVVWADLSAPGAWKRSLKENRGSLTPACCSGGDGV